MLGWLFGKRRKRRKKTSRTLKKEWRELRAKVLEENREWYGAETCERCQTWWPWELTKKWPFVRRKSWHGDHIKSYFHHPELELKRSNIQVLCPPCNRAKSNKTKEQGGEFNWRRWRRMPFMLGYPVCWWQIRKQRRVYGWKV